MVVVLPLLLAATEELAEAAVLDRVGVRVGAVLDRGKEALAEAPVVGEVVVGPKGLLLAEPVYHVHLLGHAALNACDLLGVEAELKDVRGPSVACELRVERLVAAVRLAHDEVGEPAPGTVDEDGLVDGLAAFAHGLRRLSGGGLPAVAQGSDADDVTAFVDESLKICGLVLVALTADQVSVRVRTVRLLELAAGNGDLERRQVWAGEEVSESEGEKPTVHVVKRIERIMRSWRVAYDHR